MAAASPLFMPAGWGGFLLRRNHPQPAGIGEEEEKRRKREEEED
jgi:hypothetical protein